MKLLLGRQNTQCLERYFQICAVLLLWTHEEVSTKGYQMAFEESMNKVYQTDNGNVMCALLSKMLLK